MSDKSLSEAGWKDLAKSRAKDLAPLLKLLTALAKAEKEGPAAELEALDDIEKESADLRKANKGDKELGGRLDEMGKALDKQRKTSQQALREQESSADEEEESPALLTSKLIPLVKQLRKGDVVMQALIATAGKETAVLISRRSISPARGKLLKDYLGVSGGLKFVKGECMLEENALTFVVQTQAAGLAKKLKAALLAQTELRLKVRVRGEDPDDLDEEGEEGEENPTTAPTSGETPPLSPDAQKEPYEARLAKLEPLVVAALRAQRGDTGKIRAVADFARENGRPGAYAAGLRALDALEKLLIAAAAPPVPGSGTGDAPDPAAAFTARLTALMPQVKEAIAAGGPGAQDIKLKVSEAGVLARKREFEAAGALLDAVELALRQPQAVDPGPAFNARLNAFMPRVKAALAAAGPAAPDIRLKVSEAGLAARKHAFDEAHALLDEAERLLEQPDTVPESRANEDSAARGKQAREEIEAATGKGNVRFKALLIDWRQAMQKAQAETTRLIQAIANHPLVVYDPRAAEIRERAAELVSKLPHFDGTLEAALTEAGDARGAEDLQRTRQAAAAAADAYLQTLDRDEVVRHLDDSFAGSASIYGEMQRALTRLKDALQQA